MKIIEGFKRSFFADKILFPSKKHRVCLYLPYPIALLSLIVAVILCNDVRIMVVIGLICIYLCLLPTMVWVQKATQYIRDKEKKTED